MSVKNDAASPIINRIESSLGMPGLASALASRLEPSDLQSLLLEVYRIRAQKKLPAQVLTDYQTNRFVRPSSLSAFGFLEWNRLAFSKLPKFFEALELSPVCPLGTCSAVADVTQDWSVTTSRNTEVVSDPTNVLTLEAAVRRRSLLEQDSKSRIPVHLATSHRVVRAQKFQDPFSIPHFRLFALCSAGRNSEGSDFEIDSLGIHIRYYLDTLKTYLGSAVPLRLSYSYFGEVPSYEEQLKILVENVQANFNEVLCIYDTDRQSGRSYYKGACFHICAQSAEEKYLNLVDGGAVDWTQRLISNGKEKLVISGVGADRLCMLHHSGTKVNP